jgi:hypothetical protein
MIFLVPLDTNRAVSDYFTYSQSYSNSSVNQNLSDKADTDTAASL